MKNITNTIKNIWNKGFFHVLIANLLFALVAFGSQLLVAKFLSEEELGYIKVFQSTIQIVGILAGLGFSTSLLILTADPKNTHRKTSLFQVALYNVIPISIVIWLLFMLLNFFNLSTKIPQVKSLFNSFSFIIIITAITALYTSFFQANRDFKKYSFISVSSKVLSLVLIVLTTYLYGYIGYMHGLWIGLLISLLMNILFVNKLYNLKFKQKIENFWIKTKEQLKIGIYGLGANIFGNIAIHIDIILLGYFYVSDPKLVGQYGFATIFITALSMFQGTVVQVATPFFSKYIDDQKSILKVYKKYNFYLFIATLFIFTFTYFTLPSIINFFYGSKFNEGVVFLKILLFAWLFRALNAINIAYLLGVSKTYITNFVNMLFAILNFITIYLLLYLKKDIQTMIYGVITISLIILILTFTTVRYKFFKN